MYVHIHYCCEFTCTFAYQVHVYSAQPNMYYLTMFVNNASSVRFQVLVQLRLNGPCNSYDASELAV